MPGDEPRWHVESQSSLEKQLRKLKDRVDKLEKDRSIVAALTDIAKAIRESSSGGITQEQIDELTSKVLASTKELENATKKGGE